MVRVVKCCNRLPRLCLRGDIQNLTGYGPGPPAVLSKSVELDDILVWWFCDHYFTVQVNVYWISYAYMHFLPFQSQKECNKTGRLWLFFQEKEKKKRYVRADMWTIKSPEAFTHRMGKELFMFLAFTWQHSFLYIILWSYQEKQGMFPFISFHFLALPCFALPFSHNEIIIFSPSKQFSYGSWCCRRFRW